MPKVTLIPIVITTPNKKHIQAPSRIEPPIKMDRDTFIKQYADSAKATLVSFHADGKSDPILTTVYKRRYYIEGGIR